MRKGKTDAHIFEELSESLSKVVLSKQDCRSHIHLAQLSQHNHHQYISRVSSLGLCHQVPSLSIFLSMLRDNFKEVIIRIEIPLFAIDWTHVLLVHHYDLLYILQLYFLLEALHSQLDGRMLSQHHWDLLKVVIVHVVKKQRPAFLLSLLYTLRLRKDTFIAKSAQDLYTFFFLNIL